MRKLSVFLLLTGISVSGFSDTEMPVAGKSGAGLAEVLRCYGAPRRLAELSELDFTMTDHFTGTQVTVEGGRLPEGYSASGLVCPEWWKELDVYGDTVWRDLANYYPASEDVRRHRADRPPGDVVTPTFEAPSWRAGIGRLGSIDTEFYEPPASLRGRLARTYFYMTVMYPQGIMRPRAYTMFTGASYPGLTVYGRELLMKWHREAAPDREEKELNEMMRRFQGNSNPFVDNPSFAEYLWGEKAGEVYAEEGKPVPLHSTYRLADDIWLTTPSAPSDALWSIDGVAVTGERVAAKSVGAGEHDVEFYSPLAGMSGRVMIKIVP